MLQTASEAPKRRRAKPIIKPEVKIRELAGLMLESANGDVIEAAKLMEHEVQADDVKYRALMDPLLATACYAAVSQACRGARRDVWTAPNYTAGGNGDRVHAMAAGNLLLFPLPGGKPLGEATKAEVIEAAVFYGKQASDMTVKARWLTRIGEQLTDEKTVAKVFTEESLRTLQTEVRNAA